MGLLKLTVWSFYQEIDFVDIKKVNGQPYDGSTLAALYVLELDCVTPHYFF